MDEKKSEIYISCRDSFLIHFSDAVKRLNAGVSLKGERGGELLLLSALKEYISLSVSFDPFGNLKKKKEYAGDRVKELLALSLNGEASDIEKNNKELAKRLLKANDDDVESDFDAMVTYVSAAGKEPLNTLREFYDEYVERKIAEEMNSFCARDKKFEKPKSTGFKILDEVLDGGFYPGLYVIGAPSSAGKTTFCIQICDEIAKRGERVLFFSLEMSREEIMSKSVSRLTYMLDKSPDKRNAKSERRITSEKYRRKFSEEEWELLSLASGAYALGAGKRMLIKESVGEYGVNEIERDVKAYISGTGEKPVVFVDYLQILKPLSDNMTDKQSMDRNVSALKRLCRDENITVFVVSSFNRASYNQIADLSAFKESGAIEYSADVVMSLQPDGLSYAGETDKKALSDNKRKFSSVKRMNVRPMVLSVLKNRRGKCGEEIVYDYNCAFALFSERGKKTEAETL